MVIETTKQWCTTLHNSSKLVEMLAERLGLAWCKDRGPGYFIIGNEVIFVGNVPKTCGNDRPDAKFVFLIVFGNRRVLVCGGNLDELVDELVNELSFPFSSGLI